MKKILWGVFMEKQIKIYEMLIEKLYQKALNLGLTVNDLEKYFTPELEYFKYSNPLENEYLRLASSLQNSGMMHNSIKFNEDNERRKIIQQVLFNFNFEKVLEHYSDWNSLYKAFLEKGILDNGVKENKETNWEKYCKGLFKGAEFLSSAEGKSLMNKILELNSNEVFDKTSVSLIRKTAKNIHGLGFALACDWLKECGCTWLAKPDVHIIDIYKAMLGLDKNAKVKDDKVIEYMFEWAQALKSVDKKMTAYKLDKIIWLLFTGNFYLDKDKLITKQNILEEIHNYTN